MAIPNHAEGPIVAYVNTAGTSATAKFNGSLGVVASATGTDRVDTLTNLLTALSTTTPWGDVTGLPIIIVGEPPRTPQPI